MQGNTNYINTTQEKNAVFLIGDSMRIGYCNTTKKLLEDIVDVYFPDDNCRYTQYTYVNLAEWSKICPVSENVKIVCWNNGHWDIAHWHRDSESLNSIDEYCKMLKRILKLLNKLFPNAKIVFQTTLPMNPDKGDWINDRTTDEIRAYNKAALQALKDENVYFDDLFALFEDKPSYFFADYCHLTEDGFRILGEHVAEYIKSLL